jgi:hypothetical protein
MGDRKHQPSKNQSNLKLKAKENQKCRMRETNVGQIHHHRSLSHKEPDLEK